MNNYEYHVPYSVKVMGDLNMEGNIIPHEWYKHIKFENEKVDINSIVILAEIVYWHRPTVIKDEATGMIKGYKKKFKADLLQRTYESFANQFGLSKRQVSDAIKRLEKAGLVTRVFRNIMVGGMFISNVLFIKLHADKVKEITLGTVPYHVETSYPHTQEVIPHSANRHTYTESTTKTTTKIKKISIDDSINGIVRRYADKFREHTANEHFHLTEDQMDEIEHNIQHAQNEMGIDDEDMMDIVDHHFRVMGDNDGHISYFASGDGLTGVIRRYAQDLDLY